MLKAILTIIALLSPTGDTCDVYASDLVIDSDGGIVVVDATTGDELDGTICVERGATFTTTDTSIELVVGGADLGTDGPLDAEGDMCVTVDDALTCACVDSEGVGSTQTCPGQTITCMACCFEKGMTKVRTASRIKIVPPDAGYP